MAGALVAASGALDAAAHVTRAQRLEAIRHARVWAPTAVEKMNVTAGPVLLPDGEVSRAVECQIG